MKPADSQHLKRLGGRPAFDVRQTLVYHAHRLLALFAHFQLLQQQKALEVSLATAACASCTKTFGVLGSGFTTHAEASSTH